MVIEADLHNFGRSVQKVGRASGTYYQKPRPVYWERLFFGVDSPLASFFGKGGAEFQPKHALFNLETEIDADFTGLSREVLSVPASVERNHFYSFGVLLAYCYVFGVRDLHRHNILRTATHLQVVDAEVVLVKLLLPNETLLLPFKDIGAELASVSLLQIEYPAGLTENTRKSSRATSTPSSVLSVAVSKFGNFSLRAKARFVRYPFAISCGTPFIIGDGWM